MNILYTCDNNYVWLMGISMISLFENNKDIDKINVFLLGNEISAENSKKLTSIAKKYNRTCTIIDMPDIEIPEQLMSSRWPKSAFSRLYSAMILPNTIKKILYLDCDTIILQSLNDLFQMSTDEYTIYGVRDCISKKYMTNIGLSEKDVYINAGVLLINCEKMRDLNINLMITSFLNKREEYVYYADQDILNGIFNGKIGILPAKYDVMSIEYMYSYKDINLMRKPLNYYSKFELENAILKPSIVHFTTNMLNVRPWYINSNHPLREKFLIYKANSPWNEKKLEYFDLKKQKNYNLFKFISVFPKKIQMIIIRFIHSTLLPNTIYIKGYFKRRRKR